VGKGKRGNAYLEVRKRRGPSDELDKNSQRTWFSEHLSLWHVAKITALFVANFRKRDMRKDDRVVTIKSAHINSRAPRNK
jgi:hypothetical protein